MQLASKRLSNFERTWSSLVAVRSHVGARHRLSSSRLHASASVPPDAGPPNEPVLDYQLEANASHRIKLKQTLKELQQETQEVPIVIGGKDYFTDSVGLQRVPFRHGHKLAKFHYASHQLISKAIEVALEAQRDWTRMPLEQRCRLFERAADLVAGERRQLLNAATMLGQGKTIRQAEIDAAAELADFLRFNAHYARKLIEIQPRSSKFEDNSLEFRPLDGFVAAISPFNFTAIGGNLASAPALMGNCVVWKPSDTSVLSNYLTFRVFQEAGFPAGVINFVPSAALDFGRLISSNSHLAGINFTGSLATFQWLWSEVGLNIKNYRNFPRLSGECGGKNFHLVHPSADLEVALVQTIRSAFEYSGQKCSACSRLYAPASLWPRLRDRLVAGAKSLKVGPATDSTSYLSAVIDERAYERIRGFIRHAQVTNHEIKLLCGGQTDDTEGYYVQPTIYETTNPDHRLMREEIFGPVLTIYVYPDGNVDSVMDKINESEFALTGAIFAQDEEFLRRARDRLRMSAGNLYINDKSTGAVVGQQPFGGSRHSGTNDKAGGMHYLMRWCNQQVIKHTRKRLVEL